MKGILGLLAALGLAGCASIGLGTVTRDWFDYSGMLAESWKSPMLLNLVNLRYGECRSPVEATPTGGQA